MGVIWIEMKIIFSSPMAWFSIFEFCEQCNIFKTMLKGPLDAKKAKIRISHLQIQIFGMCCYKTHYLFRDLRFWRNMISWTNCDKKLRHIGMNLSFSTINYIISSKVSSSFSTSVNAERLLSHVSLGVLPISTMKGDNLVLAWTPHL